MLSIFHVQIPDQISVVFHVFQCIYIYIYMCVCVCVCVCVWAFLFMCINVLVMSMLWYLYEFFLSLESTFKILTVTISRIVSRNIYSRFSYEEASLIEISLVISDLRYFRFRSNFPIFEHLWNHVSYTQREYLHQFLLRRGFIDYNIFGDQWFAMLSFS